jgi:hypothetical protein|tara:strand:+ start:107 stop:514 length:408 start_codon:yes stop_codon:yes gene_type:complete
MTVKGVETVRNYAVTLMLIISVGCTVADLPKSAAVTVEAIAPDNLSLIVSTRFRTIDDTRVLGNADTIQITGDYTQAYALNDEARISATLINNGELPEVVRLAVSVDGTVQFDRSGTLGPGESLPFEYKWVIRRP